MNVTDPAVGQQHIGNLLESPDAPPVMGEGCELPLVFDVGTVVHCHDRRCGKLMHVVMSPSSGRVTDLVVHHGLVHQRNRVIPVSFVERMTAEGLWLSLSSQELHLCTEYRETEFQVPAVGWNHQRYQPQEVRYAMSPYEGLTGGSVAPAQRYTFQEGIGADSRAIGKGVKLRDARGVFGEVDHVLVDCHEGDITHIVVRRAARGEYRILPIALVARVDEQGVLLRGARADLDHLPAYRPRKEILAPSPLP
jgi:hypothetical protein